MLKTDAIVKFMYLMTDSYPSHCGDTFSYKTCKKLTKVCRVMAISFLGARERVSRERGLGFRV
jgi:hypothetical protein